MRQEARFLLAITLMILVLVGTNILFPPIPPEEVSGPEGGPADPRGQAGKMYRRGASVEEVAAAVGRTPEAALGYLAEFIERERPERIDDWVHDVVYDRVVEAAAALAVDRPEPVYAHLASQVPMETIRLVLLHSRILAD